MIARTMSHPWLHYPWSALSLATAPSPMGNLRNELDRLFATQNRGWGSGLSMSPPPGDLELRDTGSELVLTAKVPGVAQDGIELTVTTDKLQLRAERKVNPPENCRARRLERQSYKFDRTYHLPVKIDPEKVQATLVDGVLTVTLSKAEDTRPRAIAVRSA